MIETIRLLRNIGTFDSVSSGAGIPLNRLSLIYAENGRGKTTLSSVLRSLASGDPEPVLERQRLGTDHPPHVVITDDGGGTVVFENGRWTNTVPDIAVFDDHFVAENVCSGIEIDSGHRHNLHEFIIGAQGVALNATLQTHIASIEEHNRRLQTKGNAIPAAARGNLTVDAFCVLEKQDDINSAVKEAERNLAAASEAAAVRRQNSFAPLMLPAFDLTAVEDLLGRDLPALEADASARVQAHIASLGDGGESWIGDGMNRIAAASSGQNREVCPFCAQDLAGSPLIVHYQAYFTAEYDSLKQAISDESQALNTALHSRKKVIS